MPASVSMPFSPRSIVKSTRSWSTAPASETTRSPAAITFFRRLKKNNKREWFQPRKELFEEQVKAPMLELVTVLMQRLADFAPDYVADPKRQSIAFTATLVSARIRLLTKRTSQPC